MGRQLGAEVHVVTVLDTNAIRPHPRLAGRASSRTFDSSSRCVPCGTVKADDVTLQVAMRFTGEPADAIVAIARRDLDAPLIVCGTTGKGAVARTLLGSVSHELVHKSGAIVMSVP